jgi:hypothetical protein
LAYYYYVQAVQGIAEATNIVQLVEASKEAGVSGARKVIAKGEKTPANWLEELRTLAEKRAREMAEEAYRQFQKVGANSEVQRSWRTQHQRAMKEIRAHLNPLRPVF